MAWSGGVRNLYHSEEKDKSWDCGWGFVCAAFSCEVFAQSQLRFLRQNVADGFYRLDCAQKAGTKWEEGKILELHREVLAFTVKTQIHSSIQKLHFQYKKHVRKPKVKPRSDPPVTLHSNPLIEQDRIHLKNIQHASIKATNINGLNNVGLKHSWGHDIKVGADTAVQFAEGNQC